MGVWNKDLVCDWVSIEAIGEQILMINLEAGQWCDMEGAIKFAKAIMPEVRQIATISGVHEDTQYCLLDGKWVAHPRA